MLSLLGVIVLGMRGKVDGWTAPYFLTVPWTVRPLAIIAGCSILTYLGGRLFRPSWRQLNRHFLLHPPTWAAVVCALAVVCVADVCDWVGPAGYRGTVAEWLTYVIPAWSVVALLNWSSRVEARSGDRPTPPAQQPRSLQDLSQDSGVLRAWCRTESHAAEDLFGTRKVAVRLARYLAGDLHAVRTVGIVGEFGAGKSSVVKWVVQELDRTNESTGTRVLTCEVSCWGFEDSSTASEHILKTAVKAVGERVDCFWFRSLPESYRKSFSAGDDWVRNVSDILIGPADVYEQFERLSQLLECLGVRLVVVIEDLDRGQSSRFEQQEIQALLYRLRQHPSLSFLITGGISQRSGIDYNRLCERVEYLPGVPPDQCVEIIQRFRAIMLGDYPANMYPSAAYDSPWSQQRTMLSLHTSAPAAPVTGMVRLLNTPRSLKCVLRQTSFVWEALNGEVDFDHLLALVALRHAANSAYEFFVANRQYVVDRHFSADELGVLRPRLQEQWRATAESATWEVVAARSLLEFLSPRLGRLLAETNQGVVVSNTSARVQGVQDRNYLQRMLTEELEENEPPDQSVLRAMSQWVENRTLASALVAGVSGNPRHARSWQYFARNDQEWRGERFLAFAAQVIATHDVTGAEYQGGFSQDHQGMISLWQLVDSHVSRDDASYAWLEGQVRQALSRSLVLVEHLYYYWGSRRYGMLASGHRLRLREFICVEFRARVTNAQQLLAILHPTNPYELSWLVSPPGDDGRDGDDVLGAEMRGVQFWNWLGPILRDALLLSPGVVAPKIASLIGLQRDRGPFTQPVVHIRSECLNGYFPNCQAEVLNLLRSEGTARREEQGAFVVSVANAGFAYLSDPDGYVSTLPPGEQD